MIWTRNMTKPQRNMNGIKDQHLTFNYNDITYYLTVRAT